MTRKAWRIRSMVRYGILGCGVWHVRLETVDGAWQQVLVTVTPNRPAICEDCCHTKCTHASYVNRSVSPIGAE